MFVFSTWNVPVVAGGRHYFVAAYIFRLTTVNCFAAIQYEICYKGFNYDIYTFELIKLVKLSNIKFIVRIYLLMLYTRYILVKLSTGILLCCDLGFIYLIAGYYVVLF